MRRPVGLLALVALGLIGCPGNNPANTASTGPHPLRSTLGVVKTPTPKPKDTPSSSASGLSSGGSSPAPTLKPPIATDDPESPLPPGQVGFALGKEATNTWNLGPFLVRPRAGMVAGNVGSAIIVAEGEHRPSLEVLDPDNNANWVLDDRVDPTLHPEVDAGSVTGHDHGGGLMFAAGGVLNNELWAAGGYDGQLSASNAGGITNVFLYREVEGFSRDRTSDQGGRTLNIGVRSAAAGVIGTNLLVAGGYSRDGVYGDSTGGFLNPKTFTDVQKVDLARPAATTAAADLPEGVAGAASATLNGHFYVLGGYTFDSKGVATTVADVQDYDANANKWTKNGTVPALPVALHDAAATAFGHQLFVAGGFDSTGKAVATFYVFDLNNPSGTWTEYPRLPTARGLLALVPFKDGLWAIGGMDGQGQMLRTVEKFIMDVPNPSPSPVSQ